MTKECSLKTVRTWDRAVGENTPHRRPAKSKGLNKQIRDFEAAMASKKKHDRLSKKKQALEENPQPTKILNERDERDILLEGVASPDDGSSTRKQNALDSEDGSVGQEELVEPYPSSEPLLRSGHRAETFDLHTTDPQPRVDFQRYQDIIDKISVNHSFADDSKDVNIKFVDETLDGAQVVISKSGDRVKIRWLTDSGSVYRLLAKQRIELQQHLYGHLGIRSEVSVALKKEVRPRFARKKMVSVQPGVNPGQVDAV